MAKRFQFHLSTLMAMMFMAGLLHWANTTIYYNVEYYEVAYSSHSTAPLASIGHRGWPIPYDVIHDLEAMRSGGNAYDATPFLMRSYFALAIDAVVSVICFIAVGLGLEFITRRRSTMTNITSLS